jgi:gamma-glutamyltranspeptidase/glutathione hydrolase
LVAAVIAAPAVSDSAIAERAMVATGSPIATDAAVAVLREGGNAVDAAVTAALTLGVVDGQNSGIGGGCLILIRSADGKLTAIDGRETAPAAAHRDMFLRDGKPLLSESQTGPLASGVPGALAAYELALKRCGTIHLARALEPGRDAAEDGFEIPGSLAEAIGSEAENLRQFGGSRAVFIHPDGKPAAAGERLVQTDLAATYGNLAEHGTAWFYRGPFARTVGDWMAKNGGIMTEADFANYQAKLREPLKTAYRGHTIIGFPPPSSGGIHVAQVLNILEQFDLASIAKRNRVEATHIIVEAFDLAFADRAYWLGDADFVDVPRGLISKDYARKLAAKIDRERAVDVASHGTPPGARHDVFERHTTHIAAADAAGNWVAITTTVNTAFGSKVIVPGTGVMLNNQMDDFSISPGVPNAFGLVGAENNSIAPGKRPLSSMSPTIVLDADGKPVLTVGAAGGPKIISQVVLTILRSFDFDEALPEAVAGPRLHHQWRPSVVMVEHGLDPHVVEGLQERGHRVEDLGSAGRTQAIAINREGQFIGVADPRGEGKAAGLQRRLHGK